LLELVLTTPDSVRVLPDAAEGHVQVWEEHGRICSYAYMADGCPWIHVPDVATFRIQGRDPDVLAIPESGAVDLIAEAFERHVLPMALQALGHEVLHASAVLMPRGVVAFSGNSGSGKSTLAQAMTLRDYPAWADDAVMFERAEGDEMRALRLPFKINLRAESASFLGLERLERQPVGSPAGASAPFAAIVFLARGRADSSTVAVRRLASTEAYKALLLQAYCFSLANEKRNARTAEKYLELAAHVPTYEVSFAAGFERLGGLVERVEELVRECA
jgi:hypothetical protein